VHADNVSPGAFIAQLTRASGVAPYEESSAWKP